MAEEIEHEKSFSTNPNMTYFLLPKLRKWHLMLALLENEKDRFFFKNYFYPFKPIVINFPHGKYQGSHTRKCFWLCSVNMDWFFNSSNFMKIALLLRGFVYWAWFARVKHPNNFPAIMKTWCSSNSAPFALSNLSAVPVTFSDSLSNCQANSKIIEDHEIFFLFIFPSNITLWYIP